MSATYHYRWEGRLWSQAPYVREINLWADLFPRVVIVGPTLSTAPPGDCVPFATDNVEVVGVPPTGGETASAKLHQLVLLPLLIWRICQVLRRADAIHVRCPGNVGLLGVVFAPLFSRRLVAKYAGQWNAFPGEEWTVRLQRALLRSRWWRGPVTVYGEWPDQPPHVVPFFTSVLSDTQIATANEGAPRKRGANTLRLLFVGRLSGPKNVTTLLRAVARIRRDGVDVRCTIVGDGAERSNLEDLASDLGITEIVDFVGAIAFEEVLLHYEIADTLVLVSESEGWPKAIAEAMTFGLVCVGSDRGMVPQMLGDGRGVVVPPRDAVALAEALGRIASDPEKADEMGRRAAAWGRRHSLEGLQASIAGLLSSCWGVPIGAGENRVRVLHVTDTLAAGGAERVAVNFVNLLPRDGFEPSLCTTRHEGLLASEVADDVGRLELRRAGRLNDVFAVRRLTRFLRDESIDIIHAHGTSLFIAAAARLLVPRTRLIWHDHLGTTTATRQRKRRLYRLATAHADHVITVSRLLEAWADAELRLPPGRVTTIPNFVTPVNGDVGHDEVLHLPGHPGWRIACVANLRPQKDHLMLLRAMALVVEKLPEAHALLIGAPIDQMLEQTIRERISTLGLAGNVTLLGARPDVSALLAYCDVAVLSSSSEGFPLALLEYGMAALPVVATTVGECGEILGLGAAGRLVPPGDHVALAEALCDLLTNPSAANELGEKLRQRVEDRYSADSVLAQVGRVYHTVLAGDR